MKPLVVEGEEWFWAAEAPGHVKAFLSNRVFHSGLNRTIHLNQSPAAQVPDDFLFTKKNDNLIILSANEPKTGKSKE